MGHDLGPDDLGPDDLGPDLGPELFSPIWSPPWSAVPLGVPWESPWSPLCYIHVSTPGRAGVTDKMYLSEHDFCQVAHSGGVCVCVVKFCGLFFTVAAQRPRGAQIVIV